MQDWKHWVCMLGMCVCSLQAAAQPEPDTTSPEVLAGQCASYLVDRGRVQQAKDDTLEHLHTRVSVLDSALSVLSQPRPRPAQAMALRQQAADLSVQIELLQRILAGQPSEEWAGRPLNDVYRRVVEFNNVRSRHLTLADAYQAEGRDRSLMADRLLVEKQRLSEEVRHAAKRYDARLDRLHDHGHQLSEAFEEIMLSFARIDDLHGVSAQAVRLHAVFTEGRLSYHWADRRGAMIASATVWLRVKPETQTDPPNVHGRYPVLLQNQQEAQISAGHFQIDFRVSVEQLSGPGRVLEAATVLLDIEALGRLVPRRGDHGLD